MIFLQNNKFNTKIKNCLFFCCVFFFFFNGITLHAQKKYVVVIDAGHGGKDPGNLGNRFKEKNIALKVALNVGRKLAKKKDIKVIYTRNKDVFIELWKRGDIANHAKADLFVSIHCDSHTSNAYGAGTFVLGLRGNKENLEIAKRENVPHYFLGYSMGALINLVLMQMNQEIKFHKMILFAPAISLQWYTHLIKSIFFLTVCITVCFIPNFGNSQTTFKEVFKEFPRQEVNLRKWDAPVIADLDQALG